MQLIVSDASPYVRKVRVLIREAGMTDHVEEVEVHTTPMDSAAEAVTANPLGRIPALIRPDGPSLYDSRVISRYLDAAFQADLYPETRLWEVLTSEATADGLLDSAVGMVYEVRFRGENAWAPWLDAQWAKVDRALTAVEERWMSHLSGKLTMGQIAMGCALGYLDLRHGDRDWRAGREALKAWYSEFSERPAMQETAPG